MQRETQFPLVAVHVGEVALPLKGQKFRQETLHSLPLKHRDRDTC